MKEHRPPGIVSVPLWGSEKRGCVGVLCGVLTSCTDGEPAKENAATGGVMSAGGSGGIAGTTSASGNGGGGRAAARLRGRRGAVRWCQWCEWQRRRGDERALLIHL